MSEANQRIRLALCQDVKLAAAFFAPGVGPQWLYKGQVLDLPDSEGNRMLAATLLDEIAAFAANAWTVEAVAKVGFTYAPPIVTIEGSLPVGCVANWAGRAPRKNASHGA